MKNRKNRLPAVPGASSLLVILSVLMLTVFAVFSISMAGAEQKLTEMTVSAIADYYASDCEAERILSELRQSQLKEGTAAEEGVHTYTCRISGKKLLQVTVFLSDVDYEILQWQGMPDGAWEPDDRIQVWDGETEGEVEIEEGSVKGEGIWPL